MTQGHNCRVHNKDGNHFGSSESETILLIIAPIWMAINRTHIQYRGHSFQ